MRFRWDEFELDVPAHRLTGPDGDVHVEPQVFDVLAYLVEHRDRVVTKAELLDNVWGDQFVSESALTTRIKSARKALGDDGRKQLYIRNVHGRGYQFVGEPAAQQEPPSEQRTDTPDIPARIVRLGASIAVDDEFPFVGREAELAAITSSVTGGLHSSQVFIGGAPGHGKSRLALEVLDRASEALVCAGRCDEALTAALQPVRDAIGQLVASHPNEFRRWSAGLEGQLLHLLPSTARVIDGRPVAVDGYASIDVLLALVDRISASSPLYLLVDDLQWSDEPTRAFLAQLHRRFGDRPIVTVATYRSGTPDLRAGAKEWISTQRRQPHAVRIDLEELDAAAAHDLADKVLGPDTIDVDDLLARTGGHALFLTETIRDRSLGADASGSVAELVTSRLERLDKEVGDLVRAGAVYGPTFPFEIAGAAADLTPAAALDAIDAAIDAELLHETDSPSEFRFSHQLIPEAIRGSLSRAALAGTHHRLAEALESSGADPATVAWHVLGAVPLVQVETALERAIAAAQHATEENEFDRAIRLLERCLEADMQTRQRAELLVLLGQARVLSGRSIAAVPIFDEATELARANRWSDLLIDCALGRFGSSPFRDSREHDTVALIREALDAVPDGPSVERARLLGKLAAFSTYDLRLPEREAMAVEANAMSVDAEPIERLRVLESQCIVLSCPEALPRLEEAEKELHRLLDDTNSYWADAAAPETAQLWRGNGDGFRKAAEVDEIRTRRQPIAEWRDSALLSTISTFEGDVDAARDHCDHAASIGGPYWGESAPVLQAFSHLLLDQITDQWERSAALFGLMFEFTHAITILPPAGLTKAMTGDIETAAAVADDLAARRKDFEWFGEYILGGNMLSAAAELGVALDHDPLCELAEEHLLPYQHLMLGLPWGPSLAASDSLARLAARRGDHAAAAGHLATARELYSGLDAPALLARLDRLHAD